MLKKFLIFIGLVSAGLLLYIINNTTPSSVGAEGLLGIFFLTYLAILSFITFLVWGFELLIWKLLTFLKLQHKKERPEIKKAYYFGSILSLGPVILIGLQSVNGLGWYELTLVAIFLILGCFYVNRRVV